jgi:zinc finger CCHC domain-containing protein 9
MTRYTKLEKRKLDYVKDSRSQGRDGSDRSSSPASVASTSALPVEEAKGQQASPAAAADEEEETTKAAADDGSKKKAELSEPSKLLKRIKLLRLKAKKSNDTSRKNTLNRQIQDMERRINVLNGERGAQKKEKAFFNKAIASGVNPWKAMEAERRKVTDVRSAVRREKRQEERESSTRCFACRQMGHSAKTCPTTTLTEPSSATTQTTTTTTMAKGKMAEEPLICCYRCGSTEHSLAKCRKSAPEYGPDLPFASCFICGEKGHISSKCSLNQGRGIYPNGGCCLLCQSVDHLAKDCPLRAPASGINSVSNAAISLGGGDADVKTAADEDDFHLLSRKKHVIEQQEKAPDVKKRKVSKKVVSF